MSYAVFDTKCSAETTNLHNIAYLHLGGQRNFYSKYRLNSIDQSWTGNTNKCSSILPQSYTQISVNAALSWSINKTLGMTGRYGTKFIFYMSYPQADKCDQASDSQDLCICAAVSVLPRTKALGL